MGLANPDAIITPSVNRVVSLTQEMMMVTSGADPDVTSALVPGAGDRISRKSNNSFDVKGGNPR